MEVLNDLKKWWVEAIPTIESGWSIDRVKWTKIGDYPTVLGADSTRAQWYYGPIVLGVDGPMPLKSRAH